MQIGPVAAHYIDGYPGSSRVKTPDNTRDARVSGEPMGGSISLSPPAGRGRRTILPGLDPGRRPAVRGGRPLSSLIRHHGEGRDPRLFPGSIDASRPKHLPEFSNPHSSPSERGASIRIEPLIGT